MNLLIIENSTPWLSIALKRGSTIIGKEYYEYDPADIIIKAVSEILKEGSVSLSDIDAFGIGLGPGSFTGLRIACSIVKGFSLTQNKPLLSLASFRAIASSNTLLNKKTVVISDARRGMVYTGIYKEGKGDLKTVQTEKVQDLKKFLEKLKGKDYFFTGESLNYKDQIKDYFPESIISGSIKYPKAKNLISLAETKYKHKEFTKIKDIEPYYLHKDSCQVKKS